MRVGAVGSAVVFLVALAAGLPATPSALPDRVDAAKDESPKQFHGVQEDVENARRNRTERAASSARNGEVGSE